MENSRNKPGEVRDAIIAVLEERGGEACIPEIHLAVSNRLGRQVPASSIRSYLRLNQPLLFTRSIRGTYKLTNTPSAHTV